MNIVLIPVYKINPDENEKISFIQCLKVLHRHPIALIAPEGFNSNYYELTSGKFGVTLKIENFDPHYFNGVNQYNQLLLSEGFYTRFKEYDYMLIYQLDAYVFSDEFGNWCKLGYDYIGAPIFGDGFSDSMTKNVRIGNGGFSLRKIERFITALSYKCNLLSAKEIIIRFAVFRKPWTRIPLLLLMMLGYRNKISYFIKNWKYNEDDFWSGFLKGTDLEMRVPSFEIALQFSFECFPSKLFNINRKKLPFGCHAWERYEYELFWKSYIFK